MSNSKAAPPEERLIVLLRHGIAEDATEEKNDETDTFTVPAKTTMQLTDIVMSNPQGDFGRVRVRIGGRELFDMALENFRDIDYHFVTPINGAAGDQLEMVVNCRKAGQPPQQSTPPTTCDTAMYVGGELTKKVG